MPDQCRGCHFAKRCKCASRQVERSCDTCYRSGQSKLQSWKSRDLFQAFWKKECNASECYGLYILWWLCVYVNFVHTFQPPYFPSPPPTSSPFPYFWQYVSGREDRRQHLENGLENQATLAQLYIHSFDFVRLIATKILTSLYSACHVINRMCYVILKEIGPDLKWSKTLTVS